MLKVDFVSDVACPWCAVGLSSFELALERLHGQVDVHLQFQPFELNPQMGPEGEDAAEHLSRKYGLTPEQLERNRESLRQRGRAVGFEFGQRTRVWNTFDAHRLLYWAGLEGHQRELKHALLQAYHGRGENPSDIEVLARAAREAGLDESRAREVIASGQFTDEVRADEQRWQSLGIHAVPSVVIDGRYLIQGGQPPEAFEQALRQVAQELAAQGNAQAT